MITGRDRRLWDALELHAIGVPAEDAADAAGVPGEGAAVASAWRSIQQCYRALAAARTGSLEVAREARPATLKRGATLRLTQDGTTTTYRVLSVRPLKSGRLNVRLDEVVVVAGGDRD